MEENKDSDLPQAEPGTGAACEPLLHEEPGGETERLEQLKEILKMKYKEKKFTKFQLKHIENIRKSMEILRNSGIHVEGKQWNLTFWVKENYDKAAAFCSGRDNGIIISNEIVSIDDSGADDQLYYSDVYDIKK